MGFIKFDKNQLINLEYSLHKEMLRSNRSGSFSCHTIVGCNTRKYHGLLICPQPLMGNTRHILLSKLDETVIQHDAEFNIGINRYKGEYNPKGHKYIRDFSADIIPKITYRVGGVVLTKETLFVTHEEKVMVRYTLVEASSHTVMRIRPFLAFRNIHSLSKKNIYLDTKYQKVPNGIKTRMYEGYTPLYMQFSKAGTEYVHSPDWYNDFEYFHEQQRGYEYMEDLYAPGFFEFHIKTGESVIFCAGTHETNPGQITRIFNKELKSRTPRSTFNSSLINSAEQFFFSHAAGTDIIAGYPWYDRLGRYTFISLPGLVLAKNNEKACHEVLETMVNFMSGPFFPETGRGEQTLYNGVDTPLWFIWALQGCCCKEKGPAQAWKEFGKAIKTILESYAAGNQLVSMRENGLLYIHEDFPAVTWMNAIVNNTPVTPRYGFVVEVNALWFNAIMFAIQAARAAKDHAFVRKWQKIAVSIPDNFYKTFCIEGNAGLVDFVADDRSDMSVRPNQVIAASMPFSPLKESAIKYVLDVAIKQLLTPKGLRTLSPQDPAYKGKYKGDEYHRDIALHQGTVYPWLLGHFVQAYLKIYKKDGLAFVQKIYDNFQEDLTEGAIGTIAELYDGNPPQQERGAISFAASVAEMLRIKTMLDEAAL